MSEVNNQEFIDAAELEGMSPEVQEKYKEFVKPAEPATVDPVKTDPTPDKSVTPTVTGDEGVKPDATLAADEDEFSKQYPGNTVPLDALRAERKKRQELEKELKGYAAQPPAQPAPVQPVAPVQQPVPAPQPVVQVVDVNSKEFNRRLTQEAVNVWQAENPNEVYDATDPVHMAEVIETKQQLKNDYIAYQEREAQKQQSQVATEQIKQRISFEEQQLKLKYGVDFAAIDGHVKAALEADEREKIYLMAKLQSGDVKPMLDFYNKTAEQYRSKSTPQTLRVTDAEKIANLEALPGTSKMQATKDAGAQYSASDIERMIMDGSWRTLPEKQRQLIIERHGGD